MYYRGIFPRFYKGSRDDIVKQFFERDGKGGQFTLDVERQLENSKQYTQYLIDHGLTTTCQSSTLMRKSLRERQEPDKTSDAMSDTLIKDMC